MSIYLKANKIIPGENDICIEEYGDVRTNRVNGIKMIVSGTGIYDVKKFQKMFSCKCGKTVEKGKICPICNTKTEKVNYYFKLACMVPNFFFDIKELPSNYSKYSNTIEKLLKFTSCISDNEIVDIDISNAKDYIDKDIVYGIDAVYLFLGISKGEDENLDKFIENNMSDIFFICDYESRKPRIIGDKFVNNDINLSYENLIKTNNNLKKIFSCDINKLFHFISAKKLYDAKNDSDKQLLKLLTDGDNSFVKKQCVSQKIAGAVRGTIVPNNNISEDEILIGTFFADSLFPEFIGKWNNANELNALISKGVRKIDHKITNVFASNISRQELLDIRDSKPGKWSKITHEYPWFNNLEKYPNRYSQEDINKYTENVNNYYKGIGCYIDDDGNEIPWEYDTSIAIDEIDGLKKGYYINNEFVEDKFGDYWFYHNKVQMVEEWTKITKKKYDSMVSEYNIEKQMIKDGYDIVFFNIDGKIVKVRSQNGKNFEKLTAENVPYLVLANRPPTICQLSIWAGKPIFVDGVGVLSRFDYEKLMKKNPNMMPYNDYRNTYSSNDLISLSPLICDGPAADFDGDVIFLSANWTKEANLELQKMMPSKNYITVDSGKVRNKIPTDFICEMKNIYTRSPELAKKIHDIINS